MKTILKNWKTSLLGGGVLTAGLTLMIEEPNRWKEGAVMMAVGVLGLLSKDHNVSGK